MCAYLSFVGLPDQIWQVVRLRHISGKTKESLKFFLVLQQRRIDAPRILWQSLPFGKFVEEEVACLLAVIHGIVGLVDKQLVVLHEFVVGTLRKQQRREIERVDQMPAAGFLTKQIGCVVVYDIVAAKKVHLIDELEQAVS